MTGSGGRPGPDADERGDGFHPIKWARPGVRGGRRPGKGRGAPSRRIRLTTGPEGSSFVGTVPKPALRTLALTFVVGVLFASIASKAAGPIRVGPAVDRGTPPSVARAANDTIESFCVDCHNDAMKTGGMSLDGFDVAKASAHRDIAEKMVQEAARRASCPRRTPRSRTVPRGWRSPRRSRRRLTRRPRRPIPDTGRFSG